MLADKLPSGFISSYGSINFFLKLEIYTSPNEPDVSSTISNYVRGQGGAKGALAPPEFGGSEKRTERETENLLLIAP